MSAIGEYVHLSYANYLKYGTNHQGSGKDTGYTYKESKLRINKKLSRAKVTEFKGIEEFVEQIKHSNTKKYEEIREAILEELNKNFEGYIKSVDFSTGKVQTTINLDKAIGKVSKDDMADASLEKITQKVNKLESILAGKLSEGTLSRKELKYIEKMQKNIEDLYSECIVMSNVKSAGKRFMNKKNKLRDAMNEAIGLYAKYPPKSLIEGSLWEYVLAVAQNDAYYKGALTFKEAALEAIKKNVTGASMTNVIFDLGNITNIGNAQAEVGRRLHLSVTKDGQHYLMNRRSKTDVAISWDELQLNISAKSININNSQYKQVHVVSGSPMISMLAGLDANFVNHYLNVAITHSDRKSKASMIGEGKEIKQDMKKALFYQALTGDNFSIKNNDIANVFAVNDKVTGKFRLVAMDDLLGEIINNLRAISVTLGTGGTNIMNFVLTQKRERTYEDRINKILSDLHNIKISASFNIMGTSLFK